jgi:hypothetical protein
MDANIINALYDAPFRKYAVILLRVVRSRMCGDNAREVQMRDHFIKYGRPLIEYEGLNPYDSHTDEILKRCLEGSVLLDIGTGSGDTP